jgi:hypothetical protein
MVLFPLLKTGNQRRRFKRPARALQEELAPDNVHSEIRSSGAGAADQIALGIVDADFPQDVHRRLVLDELGDGGFAIALHRVVERLDEHHVVLAAASDP